MLILVLVAAGTMLACSASPPQPAASATFIPGKTWVSTTTSVTEDRVAVAYVADSATEPQVRQLALRIASLPEVERYAFMTKEDALRFFTRRFGRSGLASVPANPLPRGFWLVLYDADQLTAVVAKLRDDPAIRRDGSPFSGVKTAREFYAEIEQMRSSTWEL